MTREEETVAAALVAAACLGENEDAPQSRLAPAHINRAHLRSAFRRRRPGTRASTVFAHCSGEPLHGDNKGDCHTANEWRSLSGRPRRTQPSPLASPRAQPRRFRKPSDPVADSQLVQRLPEARWTISPSVRRKQSNESPATTVGRRHRSSQASPVSKTGRSVDHQEVDAQCSGSYQRICRQLYTGFGDGAALAYGFVAHRSGRRARGIVETPNRFRLWASRRSASAEVGARSAILANSRRKRCARFYAASRISQLRTSSSAASQLRKINRINDLRDHA